MVYCPNEQMHARHNQVHFQNVFGIADDILILEYNTDGRDYDRTLRQVLQISHQKLKLNRNKYHFMGTKMPFFGEVIYRERLQVDPKRLCSLTEMLPQ